LEMLISVNLFAHNEENTSYTTPATTDQKHKDTITQNTH